MTEDILDKLSSLISYLIWIFGVMSVGLTVITLSYVYNEHIALPYQAKQNQKQALIEQEKLKSSGGISMSKELIIQSGLQPGEGVELVIATCTACHSGKLVTQNRADKKGWKQMIVWMQQTQNLWDLGDNESIIIDYLATHYGPTKSGRRALLTDINWYQLNE